MKDCLPAPPPPFFQRDSFSGLLLVCVKCNHSLKQSHALGIPSFVVSIHINVLHCRKKNSKCIKGYLKAWFYYEAFLGEMLIVLASSIHIQFAVWHFNTTPIAPLHLLAFSPAELMNFSEQL